ncbi:MAG: uroporphyrinogen decarboxylase [Eubacteriales bacterium]|nr:uroporphyrinogen decarboxylase [Eubacteriales bacterium]
MTDAKTIKAERTQNLHDVYDNKIPKRVPISFGLGLTTVADYAGVDRKDAYWNPSLLEKASDELCEMIPSDTCMYSGTVYTPYSAQSLGAKNKIMSDTGYMQHPNTVSMFQEDYDEFIKDPYATIIEKFLPRIYDNMDPANNPTRSLFALVQEANLNGQVAALQMPMMRRLAEKHGYPDGEGRGGGGRTPLDWLADQLRSFDGICVDVRRIPDKVVEALDAAYPMLYKSGRCPDPNNVNRYAVAMFQLHMATYLNEKAFVKTWYEPWKRQLEDYSSLGMRCGAFLEENWTKKIDYLLDLPTGMYFTWEYGDPKLFKEKLGKKFVLSSGFPLKYLTQCTKDEIIDKTKEWLDIMMPGGQYIFGFDKSALTMGDINLENLKACFETVLKYGGYDNAGAPTGEIFNKADYTFSNPPEFKSRAYRSWEDYKKLYPNTPESAKKMVMAAEDAVFSSIFYMSC